ncbi:MAG: DUF4167 domain-containing protein [Pseudomonadota bacterium]
MRPAQKSNRARGRGNRKNGGSGGNNINRVYESAGPEGKVRGTPQQIVDKYLSLARDAQTSGDRVMAENFLQHAEHYQRLLLTALGAQESRRETGAEDDEDDNAQPSEARANGHAPEQAEQPRLVEGAAAPVAGPADAQPADAEQAQTGQQRDGRRSRRGRGTRNGAEPSDGAAVNGDARPAAAEAPADNAEITGFGTIETDGGTGPDLLVETDELEKSQSRRRPRRVEPPAAETPEPEATEQASGENTEG